MLYNRDVNIVVVINSFKQLLGGRDMKENEISRILAMQERLLMLNELIVPEVLREGKIFLDEDLMLVNQLIKKAEMAVISAIDSEVERFF